MKLTLLDSTTGKAPANPLLRGLAVLATCAILAAFPGQASAAAPNITATLAPTEVSVGEAAQLTVTVQGQTEDAPEIPTVTGLSFQPSGQSSQIQIVNGAVSARVSHTYHVTANRPGTFTIPRLKVGAGSAAAQSQPVLFRVYGGAGGGSPAAPKNGPGALPPAAVNSGNDEDLGASERDALGFLRIVGAKQEYYVGELVPVELRACFRAGVELRVDGLPRLNGDAFLMNKLGDQPARSEQLIGGVPYTILTWSTALTAVKAGHYEMNVELPTTVTVRERASRPRRRGGPFDEFFNDSFFDSFFGTATQKQIALESRPDAVQILPLPAEARPANFAGAVGRFDLSAEIAPTETTVGDPLTLRVKLTGAGNFDRVTAPALEKSDAWKTYKPSARFEPDDRAGLTGSKTFEQALVPTHAGKLSIPGQSFSYFDPQRRQYVTRTTPALAVQVAPGQVAAVPAPPTKTVLAEPASPPATTPHQSVLAPQNSAADFSIFWLHLPRINPGVAAGALGVIAALGATCFFVRRQQRLARDPKNVRLAHARRAVQAQLQTMESAAQRGATAEFFAAACGAFQILLGLRWQLPPKTITLAEIDTRLNGEAREIRPVFDLADEVFYTGLVLAPDELQRWQTLVRTELGKLQAA